MAAAETVEKHRLRTQWDELFKIVHSEKLGEVAGEYDRVHSVQRALKVSALHHILPPVSLRPYLIHAVERGIARESQLGSAKHSDESPRTEEAAAFAATGAS
jgi:hypothetical protein